MNISMRTYLFVVFTFVAIGLMVLASYFIIANIAVERASSQLIDRIPPTTRQHSYSGIAVNTVAKHQNNQLMDDCIQSGATEEFCSCILDGVDTSFSAKELDDLFSSNLEDSYHYQNTIRYITEECSNRQPINEI